MKNKIYKFVKQILNENDFGGTKDIENIQDLNFETKKVMSYLKSSSTALTFSRSFFINHLGVLGSVE